MKRDDYNAMREERDRPRSKRDEVSDNDTQSQNDGDDDTTQSEQ